SPAANRTRTTIIYRASRRGHFPTRETRTVTADAATRPTRAALPNPAWPSTATQPVPALKITDQVTHRQKFRLFSIVILSRHGTDGGCVRLDQPHVRYQWLRLRLAQPTGFGRKRRVSGGA